MQANCLPILNCILLFRQWPAVWYGLPASPPRNSRLKVQFFWLFSTNFALSALFGKLGSYLLAYEAVLTRQCVKHGPKVVCNTRLINKSFHTRLTEGYFDESECKFR